MHNFPLNFFPFIGQNKTQKWTTMVFCPINGKKIKRKIVHFMIISNNMSKLQCFSKFSPLWHATIGVFLSLSLMWKIDTVNPSSRQCDKLAM